MVTTRRMTYDDLMAMPEDDNTYELVRGEIVRMPPPKGMHGNIEALLLEAIGRYLYEKAISLGWKPRQGKGARHRLVGYTACGEAGVRFSSPDDPDQVRGVDVLYLTPEQYARVESVIREEYVPEVPALVVEVISPSETTTYSNQKVTDYLTGGAREVWQLFPESRSVRIYRADGTTATVPPGDTLEGGDLLPGFSILLVELFD